MNNLDVVQIYNKINFIDRFKNLSLSHNNFKERLEGNKKEVYDEILTKYHYNIKYSKKENFYKIEENFGYIIFTIQLVLKGGVIEPMLYVKIGDKYIEPDHRFDSICEKLDSTFSRRDFPIPTYKDEKELEEILEEIFSIYEDLKREVLKSVCKP